MARIDPHLDSLAPLLTPGRRGFLMASLASGFALSVRPARATISTDSSGLVAGEVSVPVADGSLPAYRAKPAGKGPFPVLLVIEEVFGVHEHIKDMCRRFAKHGYYAIAPELYARLGDPTKFTDINDVIKLVNREPDVQAFADLDRTLVFAATDGGRTDRAGITGFCRGGRMVWMYAGHNPHLKAGVAWYGPLSGKPTEPMPTHPLDIAATIKVPILGLYGGQDQGIPQVDIDAMTQKLKAAGEEVEFHVYPEAGHGFNADYRPSYDAAAATDGFNRCLAFLSSHGVA